MTQLIYREIFYFYHLLQTQSAAITLNKTTLDNHSLNVKYLWMKLNCHWSYSPTEMKLVRIYSFRLKTKSYGWDTGDFHWPPNQNYFYWNYFFLVIWLRLIRLVWLDLVWSKRLCGIYSNSHLQMYISLDRLFHSFAQNKNRPFEVWFSSPCCGI